MTLRRGAESVASNVVSTQNMPDIQSKSSQLHHYESQHFRYTFADVFADSVSVSGLG